MDEIDLKIISALQKDGRIANAEIARQVGMAPSAVLERIRRLEERGVITGYHAQVAPVQVGRSLLAFVLVRTDERTGEHDTAKSLVEIPDVLEVHHVAGQDCYLLKVRCENTEEFGRLLRDRVGSIATVRSTQSTIVLGTFKESMTLPLAAGEAVTTNGKKSGARR
ncbi:MAG: Lrp/AsnC family transcriptional regulator [Candidatus Eisenbacteria bacterium]|uniref:Lrp/AsnC family transcriptional regulator n=1 Tax=Eiseniibacteriota bacterium TaxID=2212470 RepID=A0A849SNQ0_UNCEI|nr:Lrp/AsnC family transcriptional regulator [Candidatus Eisenbacteria bacterium]